MISNFGVLWKKKHGAYFMRSSSKNKLHKSYCSTALRGTVITYALAICLKIYLPTCTVNSNHPLSVRNTKQDFHRLE